MTDREIMENILNEIKGMKSELTAVKDNVNNMHTELSTVKDDIKSMKIQQQEDHLILKALEHCSEVNKAEHDKMFNSIAHIEGHQKNVDDNIDAIKSIIGKYEVDIEILKRRPV